jgi:hypothetical protein
LKSNARSVVLYWRLNWHAEARQDLRMLSHMEVRLSLCSLSYWAWVAIRSTVESGFMRFGIRKVASVMLNGRRGSTPCAM